MDDSKLLQELNLAARQPRRAPHHFMQATTSEGLAQGLYMAASGFEPPNTTEALPRPKFHASL